MRDLKSITRLVSWAIIQILGCLKQQRFMLNIKLFFGVPFYSVDIILG